MNKIIASILIMCISVGSVLSQESESIYKRPFIDFGKTAVGGYLEANSNYFSEDGVSEGFSMEMRRFNIFLFSKISKRVKFLSELEFEHGTEEIALETAQLDFEFSPFLNFRAGIILPEIGLVNSNHDSPKWEIIDRPLSSTSIIPSTLSEVGFGLFGNLNSGNQFINYHLYATNGLQDGIILNEEGRTHIASGKSLKSFEEDNNGRLMYNAKISVKNNNFGEIGFSYYGGVYNTFALEGEVVSEERSLDLYAIDFVLPFGKGVLQGEMVNALIDVPSDIVEIYSSQQKGGFVDLVYPLYKKEMFGYQNSVINACVRYENLDYNMGTFKSTGTEIGDEVTAVVAGLSFRPTDGTIFRANYRHHLTTDILGNAPAIMGGFQVGFATYF
ncbi:MAG: hypothetical protein HN427_00860 [Flavobacteriales bacterium]|jgi:hypothetical protein|nr:hypothetical protein [Flavobacteriales bacterium]MBT6013680.1 hypothetical protein [Flavobacteriales bacterium]MBT7481617.1 hypothetical protein [Flavobacteriales bacterium]